MKKSYLALLVSIIFILATVGSSFAGSADVVTQGKKMGEGTVGVKKGVDLTLFGSNRFIPTYCSNMNDYDSDTHDGVTLDEGGFYAGFFVRNELRLGFSGKGENFGFRVILENDIHYTKSNVDRNTYGGYGNNSSDFGSEFGVERSKFWYDFGAVRFTTGWDVVFQDLKTGGLVYGDDHPFIMLSGKLADIGSWQAYMLLIEDTDDIFGTNTYRDGDWYTYNGKLNFKVAGLTISPFATFSDMRKDAQGVGNSHAYYVGCEAYGKIGMIMPSFEAVYVGGTINDAAEGGTDDYDIGSYGLFASVKVDVMPEFQPYIGGFYIAGDDDNTDNDAEGFVGVTNITRYSPTFGMEGAYMYEHLGTLGSPLYALTPERLGGTSARYGGISGAGTGDNPGLIHVGMGATGKICDTSYKVQACYMWFAEDVYAKTANEIDDNEIGLTIDAQAKYALSNNFSISYTVSGLLPGDGTKELAGGEDDIAWITRAEFVWKW